MLKSFVLYVNFIGKPAYFYNKLKESTIFDTIFSKSIVLFMYDTYWIFIPIIIM